MGMDMIPFALGCVLLGLFVGLFLMVLRDIKPTSRVSYSIILAKVLLGCLVVVVLFRPEEEVEVGEDPAVYFYSAMAYLQTGSLRHADPALSLLDPEERSLFRYGDHSFLITKDVHLWATDEQMEEVGVFFLPAYSFLLGVPMALGLPYAAFFLSPILALGTAFFIGFIATRLCRRRLAGWLAASLFLLNPVIVWNARSIRAEWPAAFLVLAGLAICVAQLHRKAPSPDRNFLAGLAITGAMSFHVTASYVVLPLLFLSACFSDRRSYWLGWWAGMSIGILLLLGQFVWIADPYFLRNTIARIYRIDLLLLVSCAILISIALIRRAISYFAKYWTSPLFGRLAGIVVATLFAGAVLYSLQFRTEDGHLPGLPSWMVAYVSLTDFQGVYQMISRLWFGLALLGVFPLLLRRGKENLTGWLLFAVLGPASLTIGWVFNFMFETRRMVAFLMPFLVFTTTVLAFSLGDALGWILNRYKMSRLARFPQFLRSALPVVLILVCLGASVRGRVHLYTTWNYQGSFAFYQRLAEHVAGNADFIFGEYTQTTIPLERLSGRPSLPIAWGYRSEAEYRQAESIFARLVEEQPDTRFLLVTPFVGAALPGLWLEPLLSETLESQRLGRARRSVPANVDPFVRTLHMHRVVDAPADHAHWPYMRPFDGGQLGIDNVANLMLSRHIELTGMPIAAGEEIALPAFDLVEEHNRIWFIFAADSADHFHVDLSNSDSGPTTTLHSHTTQLAPEWFLVELQGDYNDINREWHARASANVHLTTIFLVTESNEITRIEIPANVRRSFTLANTNTQWFQAEFSLVLPVDSEARFLWMLATRDHQGSRPATASVIRRDAPTSQKVTWTLPDDWQWSVVALPREPAPKTSWYDFRVDPPWDPEIRGFPDNLGMRIERIVVR